MRSRKQSYRLIPLVIKIKVNVCSLGGLRLISFLCKSDVHTLNQEREGNQSNRRKTSRSRQRTNKLSSAQLTYDAECENRTRDTLMEGERSYHCANPAPLMFLLVEVSLVDHL